MGSNVAQPTRVKDESFAIQTYQLSKTYNGLVAVDSIELNIKKGELFALLGPNGAGKTTTIKMLCCLLKPTGGTAAVMGLMEMRSRSHFYTIFMKLIAHSFFYIYINPLQINKIKVEGEHSQRLL